MIDLNKKKCIPCSGATLPLKGASLQSYLKQLSAEWILVEEHHLEREYHFKNFKDALHFTNCIGELAEEEGHHPDIHLSWGKVKLIYWTHKIKGLSESDFIMAAKSDLCYQKYPS